MDGSLPVEWKPRKLNELGFIGRGKSKHRPRNDPSLYGGPYPFIQTGDVKEAEFYLTRYSQVYSEKGLSQSKLWDPGTLCITIAANIAETAILGIRACFPDSIVGFQANPSVADVRFVKYYIDTIKLSMQNISRGTTQDNLSVDKLLTFDILTPPLPTQRKIAAILSAYDDLIENNTRRIKILEEMAQALYREWFVHFRFPGHEHVQMVERELGLVPQGWEMTPLTNVSEFIRGIEPGSDKYMESPTSDAVPFLRVGDLSARDSGIFIDRTSAKNRMLNRTDIAITLDGTVGIVKMGLVGAYSTGIRKVTIRDSERLSWGFLYLLLKSDHIQSTIRAHARGATILHAGSAIDHMNLVLPPVKIMQAFEVHVSPMLRNTLVLQEKNANLRRTRDLLLPKLISGEVDVERLDVEGAEGQV